MFADMFPGMLRTQLYADPHNLFLHDLVLDSCRRNAPKTALVDASCGRRLTYAEYGDTVEVRRPRPDRRRRQARRMSSPFSWRTPGNSAPRSMPSNSPEPIPTLLNPTFREREVRYQLENSGAVLLITDGGNIDGINLGRVAQPPPRLHHAPARARNRAVRQPAQPGHRRSIPSPINLPNNSRRASLLQRHHRPAQGSHALALQSGRQRVSTAWPECGTTLNSADHILCCLPLYHIYGLNVVLNPSLILGATLVLVPRFTVQT